MKQDILKILENPEIFEINREKAHSDHKWYLNTDAAYLEDDYFFQSLNGEWQFKYSVGLDNRPKDFYKPEVTTEDFDMIHVPGHIELQGYDQIQYTNKLYPWDGVSDIRPPKIDKDKLAVLSYVKHFDLKPEMEHKRVYISFQGVEKAFSVWLNGHFVGYAEDSFTPSDFYISPYLKDKDNKLSVEVYKQSSASWLEDQDFFRFSGIFRDVFLYAKPDIHVDDVWFQTSYNEQKSIGTITVRLQLSSSVDQKTKPDLILEVYEPDSKKLILNKELNLKSFGVYDLSQTFKLKDIKKWSPEDPNLYTVLLKVYNEDELVEVIPYDIGFRKFGIEDGLMQLNGERLLINGVNRHEWNPETGRAITKEDMIKSIRTFKDNNINAVRTSHYPNQSDWYFLCDREGIMVMDETNMETHGSWEKRNGVIDTSWNIPASLKEWEPAVLDRAKSMFERDKNHPSILFWSLGNESYAGEAMRKMAEFFRQVDPSRLVHYEGCTWNREYEDVTDIESRMYAKPDEIEEYLQREDAKPFILCEYMHDMGNSFGGMESYIDLIDKYPKYQGGFIWDFMDQALYQNGPNNERVLGYGGDFGDRTTDYNFSGNGIVYADMDHKPQMQEVRYWYMPKEEREAFDKKNLEKYNLAVNELYENQTDNTLRLETVVGDGNVGVSGLEFSVLFSLTQGGPVSLKYQGQEWLYRAPKPAFWRATTENDQGNQFSQKNGAWMTVETFTRQKDVKIIKNDPTEFIIRYTFTTPGIENTDVSITYSVYPTGDIKILAQFKGHDSLPDLAVFGIRFITPEPIEKTIYSGLSGETYPDRYKGAEFGTFEEEPKRSKNLYPQEYGNHYKTISAKFVAQNGQTLQVKMIDQPFSFTALPNSPLEIEEATHQYELAPATRTTISILSDVRGVGGIDSWGADVEEAYRLSGKKDYELEIIFSN